MSNLGKIKFQGLIYLLIGFVFILVNGIGYIFNLSIKNPIFTILGLTFIVIGFKLYRK